MPRTIANSESEGNKHLSSIMRTSDGDTAQVQAKEGVLNTHSTDQRIIEVLSKCVKDAFGSNVSMFVSGSVSSDRQYRSPVSGVSDLDILAIAKSESGLRLDFQNLKAFSSALKLAIEKLEGDGIYAVTAANYRAESEIEECAVSHIIASKGIPQEEIEIRRIDCNFFPNEERLRASARLNIEGVAYLRSKFGKGKLILSGSQNDVMGILGDDRQYALGTSEAVVSQAEEIITAYMLLISNANVNDRLLKKEGVNKLKTAGNFVLNAYVLETTGKYGGSWVDKLEMTGLPESMRSFIQEVEALRHPKSPNELPTIENLVRVFGQLADIINENFHQ